VPRGVERGLERFDRDERFGEAVPYRLELRDRPPELLALDGVRTGEVEHGAAPTGGLVRAPRPPRGGRRGPRAGAGRGRRAHTLGVGDAHGLQLAVGISPARGRRVDRARGDVYRAEVGARRADDEDVVRSRDAMGAEPDRADGVALDASRYRPR